MACNSNPLTDMSEDGHDCEQSDNFDELDLVEDAYVTFEGVQLDVLYHLSQTAGVPYTEQNHLHEQQREFCMWNNAQK